jgi:hypothetical protein
VLADLLRVVLAAQALGRVALEQAQQQRPRLGRQVPRHAQLAAQDALEQLLAVLGEERGHA